MAFCLSAADVDCNRAFECVDPTLRDATFTATYGSTITECKTTYAPDCSAATTAVSCPNYSQIFAEACLTKYSTEPCATLVVEGLPAECFFVCQ